MFKVVTHPSIRENSYRSQQEKINDPEKEVQTLNFFKYRLDSNSLKITQLSLNA
jgi:hypothetical protein